MQRMDTLYSSFSSINMQATIPQIDLCPTERTKLRCPEAMSISEEDRCSIPLAVTATSTGRFNQSFDLLLCQIFSDPIS